MDPLDVEMEYISKLPNLKVEILSMPELKRLGSSTSVFTIEKAIPEKEPASLVLRSKSGREYLYIVSGDERELIREIVGESSLIGRKVRIKIINVGNSPRAYIINISDENGKFEFPDWAVLPEFRLVKP
ncbi:MAG: hypothetical protein QW203_03445 [Thermoplasmatales archaeon]